MLENFALWTAGPGVSGYWFFASFVVFIVPMVWLASWYHENIEKTDGGKKLMEKQASVGGHKYNPKLAEGMSMAREVADGVYGDHAKSMQMRAYLVAIIWAIANVFMFGIVIWGQALAKATGS